jgi:hypothetical protein
MASLFGQIRDWFGGNARDRTVYKASQGMNREVIDSQRANIAQQYALRQKMSGQPISRTVMRRLMGLESELAPGVDPEYAKWESSDPIHKAEAALGNAVQAVKPVIDVLTAPFAMAPGEGMARRAENTSEYLARHPEQRAQINPVTGFGYNPLTTPAELLLSQVVSPDMAQMMIGNEAEKAAVRARVSPTNNPGEITRWAFEDPYRHSMLTSPLAPIVNTAARLLGTAPQIDTENPSRNPWYQTRPTNVGLADVSEAVQRGFRARGEEVTQESMSREVGPALAPFVTPYKSWVSELPSVTGGENLETDVREMVQATGPAPSDNTPMSVLKTLLLPLRTAASFGASMGTRGTGEFAGEMLLDLSNWLDFGTRSIAKSAAKAAVSQAASGSLELGIKSLPKGLIADALDEMGETGLATYTRNAPIGAAHTLDVVDEAGDVRRVFVPNFQKGGISQDLLDAVGKGDAAAEAHAEGLLTEIRGVGADSQLNLPGMAGITEGPTEYLARGVAAETAAREIGERLYSKFLVLKAAELGETVGSWAAPRVVVPFTNRQIGQIGTSVTQQIAEGGAEKWLARRAGLRTFLAERAASHKTLGSAWRAVEKLSNRLPFINAMDPFMSVAGYKATVDVRVAATRRAAELGKRIESLSEGVSGDEARSINVDSAPFLVEEQLIALRTVRSVLSREPSRQIIPVGEFAPATRTVEDSVLTPGMESVPLLERITTRTELPRPEPDIATLRGETSAKFREIADELDAVAEAAETDVRRGRRVLTGPAGDVLDVDYAPLSRGPRSGVKRVGWPATVADDVAALPGNTDIIDDVRSALDGMDRPFLPGSLDAAAEQEVILSWYGKGAKKGAYPGKGVTTLENVLERLREGGDARYAGSTAASGRREPSRSRTPSRASGRSSPARWLTPTR